MARLMERTARRLRRDERGGVIVFFAVCLAVLLGIVALSFDLGRVSATQTELQSFADNVALAAAGELDGNADAITRATGAATNLIDKRQTFGIGARDLTAADFNLRFLSALPADDRDPPTAYTTDPALARFAEIRIDDREVGLTFAAAFRAMTDQGGPTEVPVRATAIAGFTRFACDITPMMFCMPNDPNWTADANIGQMIRLRTASSNAWGPGNFGFLSLDGALVDPAGPCGGLNPSGAPFIRCLLGAADFITQCFAQNGVETRTGQSSGINDRLNIRFDIYPNGSNLDSDPDYAPAPNVIKGVGNATGNACYNPNQPPASNTKPLPTDPSLLPASARFGTARTWSVTDTTRTAYVAANYPGFAATGADPFPAATTRYAFYQAEIAARAAHSANPAAEPRFVDSILGSKPTATLDEVSNPMCSNQPPKGADRRELIAAGVDCIANPVTGNTTVPVREFVRLFMTQPTEGGSGFDLFTEVVGSAGGGSGGGAQASIRDVVQLYR